MKIVVVHNYYQQAGGEESVFKNETDLLESKGHQVIRYTISNELINDLNPLEIFVKTIWNHTVYSELKELISKEKPDLVHFHNTFPLISPAAYYAAKSESVATVQTLHNYRLFCPVATFLRDGQVCEDCIHKLFPYPSVIHSCYRNSKLASFLASLMIFVHKILGTWNKQIDLFLALTEFSKQKAIEGGLPANKIFIKPNFSTTHHNHSNKNGSFALYVGRLANEKGIQTMIDAWNKLTYQNGYQFPLKIVGDGPLEEFVKESVEKNKNIQWLGRKNKTEVLELMKNAYCFIFPSIWYETFGMTIIEGFSTGLPVICTDLGAAASLVEDGVTGKKFKSGDSDDLADKVHWVLENPAIIEGMKTNCRSAFLENYSEDLNYELLMEAYVELIRKRGEKLREIVY